MWCHNIAIESRSASFCFREMLAELVPTGVGKMKSCQYWTSAQYCLSCTLFIYLANLQWAIPGGCLIRYSFCTPAPRSRWEFFQNSLPDISDARTAPFPTNNPSERHVKHGGAGMSVASARMALIGGIGTGLYVLVFDIFIESYTTQNVK